MQLTVKTSKGECYKVEVESDEKKIGDVKNELLKQMANPNPKLRFIHTGKLLQDETTLKEYQIADGTTLHLLASGPEKKAAPAAQSASAAVPKGSETPSQYSIGSDPSTDRINSQMNNLASFIGGGSASDRGAPPAGGAGQWSQPFGAPRPGSGAGNSASAGGRMPGNDAWAELMNDPEMARRMYSESANVRTVCQAKVKELMKNPEQMKSMMEASLMMNNVPEEYKDIVREQIDKLTQLSHENPAQFDALMNQLVEASDLMNPSMSGNLAQMFPGMGQNPQNSGRPQMDHHHPGGMNLNPSSTPNSFPNIPPQVNLLDFSSLPPNFNVEEEAKKYTDQLNSLRSMGFVDEPLNVIALFRTDGNLEYALHLIMEHRDKETSQ